MDLLRQPGVSTRAAGPPVTRLLGVERDGNPLRRHGHVSPHIGKIGPLDAAALEEIACLAAASLPQDTPGPTLVVGMAESALLLSWFLASRLGGDVELCFTTREHRGAGERRTFLEPHSHGPVHSLALPPGRSYGRVVIVEDELTSGATLRNLLLAIRDTAPRHHVIALSDLRPQGPRRRLDEEMSRLGVELSVLDLSESVDYPDPGNTRAPPPRNPFSRPREVFEGAVEALRRRCRSLRPGGLYAIGECVDVTIAAWETLPPAERPVFRHVTRSPWLVDGRVVKSRLELCAPPVPRHFLYNSGEHLPRRSLLVSERSTAPVAEKLRSFLLSRGIEAETVEVPTA
ncbi:hypothetical protein BH24ACT19_BH24ACT19_17770 [soil metagenome]